jgi:hypothetical protein
MTGNQVAVDNTDNRVNTTGPGTVTVLQYSTESDVGTSPTGAKQAKPAGPAKAPELMLTRIDFQDRLFSAPLAGSTTTRLSKFYGNVLAVHLPGDNLDAKVDLSKLPKGAMMIQCDVLEVTSREMPDKTTKQEMCAKGRVYCASGTDMKAQAEVACFDEVSNIITFKGSRNNPAAVWQATGGQGSPWKASKGEVMQYNRKTGAISGDGITSIVGWSAPAGPPQGLDYSLEMFAVMAGGLRNDW